MGTNIKLGLGKNLNLNCKHLHSFLLILRAGLSTAADPQGIIFPKLPKPSIKSLPLLFLPPAFSSVTWLWLQVVVEEDTEMITHCARGRYRQHN